ncbi:murein transglycosylase A [Chitinasiproducens palmae]|nr:MltA domain-containing protein [Chitinasiproducens palmae]
MRSLKFLAVALLAVFLASCASHRPSPTPTTAGSPGVLRTERLAPATWSDVAGWQDDSLIGAVAALRQSCVRLGSRRDWRRACDAMRTLDELDTAAVRRYFEENFTPFQLANADGSQDGLVTGYYEPLLHGSRTPHPPYLYPLYRMPPSLRRAGALPDRERLVRSGQLRGQELVYVDDPIEAFFLQVQGSGRIVLDSGEVMRVGFGGTNNRPYRSIGKWLIDRGELTPSQATMQGIKAWARANPSRVDALLDVNPRFVFFKEMPSNGEGAGDAGADGPVGALGVPLTPERSIAVDPSAIQLGLPVFLATTRPLTSAPLNRLMFAQDTGSAIRGVVRADFFWGLGDTAGDLAGRMKQSGRMWVLLPNA